MPGEQLEYTVTVKNTGDAEARQVPVTDTLPERPHHRVGRPGRQDRRHHDRMDDRQDSRRAASADCM
ncbi:DUF11 domain-containing protein [Microbacterium oxydans]|nr:DUF11 domain-containing protein [Microbacterium oxydans]